MRYAILIFGGAMLGSLINWAIYAWAMFRKRPISPWMKPAEGESPRTWIDRIPVAGWIGRRRDSAIHGNGFWIRPMMIELICAFGVPWFYQWIVAGGLTGGTAPPAGLASLWFWGHGVLLTLMTIGTFIDFDEKTIPDEVTVTGTIIALLLAAFAPAFRLPQVVFGMAKLPTIEHIHYASPSPLPDWHLGIWAVLAAMAIFTIWIWALLPKLPVWYVGLRKSCRFMIAHAIQPKRQTTCTLRTRQRSTPAITIWLGLLFVAGLVAIAAAWNFLPAENLASLYGAFIGMAFGGGMVWAIRIIGTLALRQEAMGFGDVTLHAMIGAFLGWQAALMVFAIAPGVALLMVGLQFVLTRQNVIAFGPYLCAGAAILIYFWDGIWPRAALGVFSLGPYLLGILAGSLVLLPIMLVIIAWFKGMFAREEVSD